MVWTDRVFAGRQEGGIVEEGPNLTHYTPTEVMMIAALLELLKRNLSNWLTLMMMLLLKPTK